MGVPGSSNALAIARRLGVKQGVVEAAEKEIADLEAPTREIIDRMQRSKRRVEKERRRAERVRRKVQDEARLYAERKQELEARKEALDHEAELEAERAVRAARDALRPLLRRLKNVPRAHRAAVEELERQVDLLLAATPLGEKREAFARSLRKGDEVYVPVFRSRGKVRRINKGDRQLTVLINGIPTELGFDDVSWIEGPPAGPPAPPAGRDGQEGG
jgi:DNA mismatch repair protein MutS2